MDTPSLQKLLDDIRAEIASGNKIQAIKLYRDATGAGLAEAKQAIELIAAGKPPPDGGGPGPLAADAMQRVTELIASGNAIEAIKLFRQAAGVDLKQAKEAVDAMTEAMLQKGEISPEIALSRVRATRRVLLGFALAVALAAGVAAFIMATALRP